MLTDASRAANFTNEGGVDGTHPLPAQRDGPVAAAGVACGLGRDGPATDLAALLGEAAAVSRPVAGHRPRRSQLPAAGRHAGPDRRPAAARPGSRSPEYAGRDRPLHPGQPGGRLRRAVGRRRAALRPARSTSCTSSAAAPERPAVPADRRRLRPAGAAGPVEATALGNVLVQARAAGVLAADLDGLRALLGRGHDRAGTEPRQSPAAWRPRAAAGGESMRIALFVTCLADAMFPDVGQGDGHGAGAAGPRGRVPGGADLLRPDACQHRDTSARRCRWSSGSPTSSRPYDAVVAPSGSCVGSVRHQHAMVARRFGSAGLVGAGERRWPRGRTSCPSCWSTCWG